MRSHFQTKYGERRNITVMVPNDLAEALEKLAADNKCSVGYIARKAMTTLLADLGVIVTSIVSGDGLAELRHATPDPAMSTMPQHVHDTESTPCPL